MILVDANVLVYAVDRDSPHHAASRTWLEGALSGEESIGLPWQVILAFLRIATRPGILRKQLSVEAALEHVGDWLAQPVVGLVAPSERHWKILSELLANAGTAGNLTSDSHLAALAIEHGATLATFDHDFRRFPGLRLVIPGGRRPR